MAKHYCPVSLLSLTRKIFEKLVNDRLVHNFGKCSLFPDFQYGFWSSYLTADLLIVVYNRIGRAFDRSGATQALTFDIFKALNSVWHAIFLPKLQSCGILD